MKTITSISARHTFLTITLLFTVFFSNAQLVINEYSCSNMGGGPFPPDEFGEDEDWVELHNAGGAAVDISGWHLSDKASNLTKWQIPSGSVPANGY